MPQGVVAWFDEESENKIRNLWSALAEVGVPSRGARDGEFARPHVTYFYGDALDIDSTVAALAPLPRLGELQVRLGSIGVFPQAVLHLPVVPSVELLGRHRRAFDLGARYVQRGHAAYAPDRWTPHVTVASAVPQRLVGAAVELCAGHLPIEATLSTGGIEDGTTGESWLVASLP